MRIGIDGDVSRRVALEHWHEQIHGAATSIARLSSGLRINSAVDDAAGLAISEGLRAKTLGSQQAQRNAQDGVNLLRVADGALAESTAIVQRLRVIAVQSANGTWTQDQRAGLQALVDAGLKGLDEIARQTEYNTVHLLDGSRSDLTLQVGADSGQTKGLKFRGASAVDLGLGAGSTTVTTWKTVTSTTPDQYVTTTTPDQTVVTKAPDTTTTQVVAVPAAATSGGLTGTITGDFKPGDYTIQNSALYDSSGQVVGGWSNPGKYAWLIASGTGVRVTFPSQIVHSGAGSFSVTAATTKTVTTVVPGETTTTVIPGTSTTTFVPGTTTTSQVAETTTIAGAGINVLSQDAAESALDVIDKALAILADERAEIGAAESGLVHTIDSLGVTALNLSEAESRIRDVDVAAEMRRLAKVQAATQASAAVVTRAMTQQYAAAALLLGSAISGAIEPAAAPSAAGHRGR